MSSSFLSPSNDALANPFKSTINRDALLGYACRVYESSPRSSSNGLSHVPLVAPVSPTQSLDQIYRDRLLPLMMILRSSHPQHKPTLLLLGCVYFDLGDFQTSLSINQEILSLDPSYVEAMCNMGTTLQAMGRSPEAQRWWWEALKLRPTYWEAMDNLLGSFLNPIQVTGSSDNALLYKQAQELCRFLLVRIIGPDGRFLVPIAPDELQRLQKLCYTNAMLLQIIGENRIEALLGDLHSAVEVVIRPPWPYTTDESYVFQDLVIAASLIALSLSAGPGTYVPQAVLDVLSPHNRLHSLQGIFEDSGFNILSVAHVAGERLWSALIPPGDVLPTILLLPDEVMRLSLLLFPESAGVLPSICSRERGSSPASEILRQQTHFITSTILLTLAKKLQEIPLGSTIIVSDSGLVLTASLSLVLLLYYIALSLSPSPSTYNNLGIILSGLTTARTSIGATGEQEILTGPVVARAFYERGLLLHPSHPHLLTNLGSHMKDQGQTSEAVRLYALAVQHKPDFDIALANLGNAIKDMGRPWESIEYFQRAVAVDPNMPEAVCGLANSRNALCDWRGRGSVNGEMGVNEHGEIIFPTNSGSPGWMMKIAQIAEEQMYSSYTENVGVVESLGDVDFWLLWAEKTREKPFEGQDLRRWKKAIRRFLTQFDRSEKRINEGGFLIRFIEWMVRRLQNKWYKHRYGRALESNEPLPAPCLEGTSAYEWLHLPPSFEPPRMPSVLPFHTFGYSLSPRIIRLISHRNALRISYTALTQPWLPQHVYPPPPPPFEGKINIGYVSSDLGNHPLAHLMQSVFGLHDRSRFNVFVYATGISDGSPNRRKIERDSQHFLDVSSWPTKLIVERIVEDQIHILINLGGYTKGARNDIFAARPSPIQLALMGFAGTLAAGWCDYLVCDTISCPPEICASERWRSRRAQGEETSRLQDHFSEMELESDFGSVIDPESMTDDWMYTEKMIYMPHTFMVTDHKQSFRGDENLSVSARRSVSVSELWENEDRLRIEWRKKVFPGIAQDTIVFANFNQSIFAAWLRILSRLPNSILWLLRFPPAGEEHLLRTAMQWAGEEVASRIHFSDVALKDDHISRGRIADLFLDTTECNAHTIAADILWSGTPMITWPKYTYKMCARVGASIAQATGFGDQMIVNSLEEYEERAISLATSLWFTWEESPTGELRRKGHGALMDLRRNLFLSRDSMPLFDTARWTKNIEKGYREAWRRWALGTEFETSEEWEESDGPEKDSGCIWIRDDDPVEVRSS
ncbi:hypothetical protein BV25DRAFT_1867220 [Artomyces pyxidatus]|uniref:Uncharacterized protein n=1 Tax=Artomyces pyxidatus TaxID=48021 RepID=A0ACB8TII1_9AGAM|nr:hypothetical protein BV25DRAFT_1867220 [Artomyces pyxidatus]